MPVVAEHKLTKEEFHSRYDGEKPYYEYWDGEAVQKAMGTSIHGVIQILLGRMLSEIGYDAGSEIELRLDPNYQFLPDVIAAEGLLEYPYPTRPFEVAIEILSPSDQFSRVLRKCRLYEKWGVRQIVVVDSENRVVWRFENGIPVETDVIATRGEAKILAAVLWEALDRRKP
jgi:Uma2 family endonuclease